MYLTQFHKFNEANVRLYLWVEINLVTIFHNPGIVLEVCIFIITKVLGEIDKFCAKIENIDAVNNSFFNLLRTEKKNLDINFFYITNTMQKKYFKILNFNNLIIHYFPFKFIFRFPLP